MDNNIQQNEICDHIDDLSVAKVHECVPETCKSLIDTSEKALIILTQNIRCIYKNFDSFELLHARLGFKCDILILTECWINEDKPFPQIPNYNMAFTKNCINKNGGIVIYFKCSINCTIEEPDFQDSNCLVLRMGNNIAIIALYRSPSFTHIDNFLNSLDSVLGSVKNYPTITVLGDINIDIQPDNFDRHSPSYLELLATHGLLPGHTLITRGEKCYDHIILKSKNECSTVILQTYLTDHCPALLSITKTGKMIAPKKLISKTNMNTVIDKLNVTDFSQILNIMDANAAAELLVNKLMEIVRVSTRIFKVPQNQRIIKPWITPGLLRCIRTRDRMHLQLKHTPNNKVLKLSYARYRNFCNKILKRIKVEYERIDEAEIYNIITGMKNDCAVGYDGISTIFIKYCSPVLVPLITHICNARARAEEGLKIVMTWLQENLLSLNINKTKFMSFTNPRSKTPILTIKAHTNCAHGSCDCPVLEQVQDIKYLGIIIDEKLNWKKHIKVLTGRVRKLIYVFKNLRDVAGRVLLINVYNSLCRSILTYCNTAWGGACITYMLQLERAQRAVLKVATFRPYRFPTVDLYSDCEVLTVRKLFVYNIILSQHKKVDVRDNLSTGRRRKDRIIAKPTVKTVFAKRQQTFLGPLLYNKANKAIKGLVN
ncbi:putative RNA-directed DNA polymerase, partial [Operophtera brumata]